MIDRIEELAATAMSNSVCAGEPHWVKDAITTAVNEALELAAKECQPRLTALGCATAIRKLRVE